MKGLNYSIEFVGGTSWQVPAPGVTVAQAQSALTPLGFGGATITVLGSGSKQTLNVEAKLAAELERRDARPRPPRSPAPSAALAHKPASAVSIETSGRPGAATSPTRRSRR